MTMSKEVMPKVRTRDLVESLTATNVELQKRIDLITSQPDDLAHKAIIMRTVLLKVLDFCEAYNPDPEEGTSEEYKKDFDFIQERVIGALTGSTTDRAVLDDMLAAERKAGRQDIISIIEKAAEESRSDTHMTWAMNVYDGIFDEINDQFPPFDEE